MTQDKFNQEKNTRIGSRGIQCTMAINSSYSWLKFFICWCEFWNETYKTSAIKEKKTRVNYRNGKYSINQPVVLKAKKLLCHLRYTISGDSQEYCLTRQINLNQCYKSVRWKTRYRGDKRGDRHFEPWL